MKAWDKLSSKHGRDPKLTNEDICMDYLIAGAQNIVCAYSYREKKIMVTEGPDGSRKSEKEQYDPAKQKTIAHLIKNVRDYIHVVDLADGHIAALHKLDAAGI
uniref:Uncharacterized protein n=1 Tax=Cucumis melo TaxID=3656 RepID=A0A9I9ECQ2_CUCME